MNSRHWHLGFPPVSSAEWMAYRADQHEASLDNLDREYRLANPMAGAVTDATIVLSDEEEYDDPVTANDWALWSCQAQWAREDFEKTIWHRTWDEIRAYWAEMRQEINAKAFAKRFEAWCEKGCPLDQQEGPDE